MLWALLLLRMGFFSFLFLLMVASPYVFRLCEGVYILGLTWLLLVKSPFGVVFLLGAIIFTIILKKKLYMICTGIEKKDNYCEIKTSIFFFSEFQGLYVGLN